MYDCAASPEVSLHFINHCARKNINQLSEACFLCDPKDTLEKGTFLMTQDESTTFQGH